MRDSETNNPSHIEDPATLEAMRALFPEQEDEDRINRQVIASGIGIIAVVAAYGAYKTGVDIGSVTDFFEASYVPSLKVFPEIVDGFVAVNEGLRAVALPVAIGGLVTGGLLKNAEGRKQNSQVKGQLARVDYSGVESVSEGKHERETSLKARTLARASRFSAGVGVAALTVLLTGGSSGVEHEVSNGPLRPVERVFDTLVGEESSRHILVQSSDITFMGDSYLATPDIDELVEDAAEQGVSVVPFNKTLPNIDGRSGLVFSVPDMLFEKATGVSITANECVSTPIILDEANTTPVGGKTDINGAETEVAAKMSGAAQMNRDVAIIAQTDFEDCVQNVDESTYFGAIVKGENAEMVVDELLGSSDLGEKATLISEEKFEENNRRFWRANGTPILLQLIGYVGALGAFAIGSERRGSLQRNIREIGMLNAIGVPIKEIKKIETRRALNETARAALIAAPFMPVVAAAFNMAEVGLKVGVGFKEIAVGYTVTLAAKMAGGHRAFKRFSKKLNLSNAVKG